MGDTSISWTMGDDGVLGKTWNCIRGCSEESEGCRNCYAKRIAARFSDPGQPYHGLAIMKRTAGGRSIPQWTGEVRMVPEHLADPLRWRKPRRIFVNSMSDLFHEKLTNEQIAAVFGVMGAAKLHTFQVLTKRAKRMREWFEWMLGAGGPDLCDLTCAALDKSGFERGCGSAFDHLEEWPLKNVWMGTSVENQEAADKRIPELLATPAAVRFLSMEPLISEVDLDLPRCDSCEEVTPIVDVEGGHGTTIPWCAEHDREGSYGHWLHLDGGLDWVIAGCESGPGARPCDVSWLRSIRDQCASAGVPFFLKQAVEQLAHSTSTAEHAVAAGDGSRRKAGGVIELPYLDGVQHAAFPSTGESS